MYPPEMPKNYSLPNGVLCSLLKTYAKEQQYLQACTEISEHQLKQGNIERAEPLDTSSPAYYYLTI